MVQIRNLSDSAYVIRLERNGFQFKPGQCVNLGLRGTGVNREYSTYSGVDEEHLEFLIKEVPGGSVSPALRRVAAGGEVEMFGPYGSFVIDPDTVPTARFVFIGTGTGIAPFHSFVKSYPGMDYTVLFGVRTESELYDLADYDPARLITCVSRETAGSFQGRVTDYLKQNETCTASIYYLCGNQAMIHDAYDLLREKGVSGNQIFTEAFF